MDTPFTIKLKQQADYRFETHFDHEALPMLVTDEPPPLGGNAGPNPSRLLGAAIANCLSASLLFAMRKFKSEPGPLSAEATVSLGRNASNRWRIAHVGVDLYLGVAGSAIANLERILAEFEDFCIVTQSVRQAFPVDVRVLDLRGKVLKAATPAAGQAPAADGAPTARR